MFSCRQKLEIKSCCYSTSNGLVGLDTGPLYVCWVGFFFLNISLNKSLILENRSGARLYKYPPSRQNSHLLPPLLPARKLNRLYDDMTVSIKKRAWYHWSLQCFSGHQLCLFHSVWFYCCSALNGVTAVITRVITPGLNVGTSPDVRIRTNSCLLRWWDHYSGHHS